MKNLKIGDKEMNVNDELVAEIYRDQDKNGITYAKTPQGDQCIIASDPLTDLMMKSTRGCWQKEVVRRLAAVGWIISYLATGDELRGKAASYSGKYMTSLRHLMERIEDEMPGRYVLESGPVGPKGGFGYYIDKY